MCCLIRSTIGRASLSRWSTVPTSKIESALEGGRHRSNDDFRLPSCLAPRSSSHTTSCSSENVTRHFTSLMGYMCKSISSTNSQECFYSTSAAVCPEEYRGSIVRHPASKRAVFVVTPSPPSTAVPVCHSRVRNACLVLRPFFPPPPKSCCVRDSSAHLGSSNRKHIGMDRSHRWLTSRFWGDG